MESLSDYIHETYGTCKLEQCECIKKNDNLRLMCPNWEASKANNWEELLEEAKRKRNVK